MKRIAWNKGLTKDDPRVAKYVKGGSKTQFKSGQKPWNTGLKGVMTPWNKGIPRTEETKQKIRETKAARKHLYPKLNGKLNPMYKPDRNISYTQKHRIMREEFKDVTLCQVCGDFRNLELSNRSGKYLLEKSDWQILCRPCHKKYDKIGENFKGKEPWRKNGKV